MTSKIKKSSSDVSFSLSRWFRKISTNTPSAFIVTVVGISYAIFLFGGGLFTLINHPLTSFYNSATGQFFFLYPDVSNQFVSDTLISIVLYALGFIGLLAVYQSTKSAYKPRQAYMLLIVGVTLLLLSYIFLEGSIEFKSSGGR
jgi:OST3 / OST6 family, transporter family